MIRLSKRLLVVTLLLNAGPLLAAPQTVKLEIKNRAFDPAALQVPAGVKIKLVIHNADAVPAEFESYDLAREIIVPGGVDSVVYIGPLDAGRYQFFNDFNHAATGHVIATDP